MNSEVDATKGYNVTNAVSNLEYYCRNSAEVSKQVKAAEPPGSLPSSLPGTRIDLNGVAVPIARCNSSHIVCIVGHFNTCDATCF